MCGFWNPEYLEASKNYIEFISTLEEIDMYYDIPCYKFDGSKDSKSVFDAKIQCHKSDSKHDGTN